MIEITMELARACGMDAGNLSMRRAGRTAWNDEDYAAACAEMARLWLDAAQQQREQEYEESDMERARR
jgi:hypothetical protein